MLIEQYILGTNCFIRSENSNRVCVCVWGDSEIMVRKKMLVGIFGYDLMNCLTEFDDLFSKFC